ncbi:DUF2996 domain-containing protein [filamentous cyanobacterium CCP2]|nr:DUF2996 domain-containing protein [filamentous cyanobacterium CCP2]
MSDETTPNTPEEAQSAPEAEAKPEAKAAKAPQEKPAAGDKPARPPKKEKPPAVEDKPFPEFITQHFMPGLTEMLGKLGVDDLDLKFEKQPLPIPGLGDAECWQVIGHWQNGHRQFNIIFSKEDITAPKYFCFADNGAKPSTIESFMIDERKVSLDLLLLYTVQRLNGQKWLVRN